MQFDAENLQALLYQHQNLNMELTEHAGLQGITIQEPKSVTNLGIDMKDDTYFQVHIATTCRQLAGLILKTFRTRDNVNLS